MADDFKSFEDDVDNDEEYRKIREERARRRDEGEYDGKFLPRPRPGDDEEPKPPPPPVVEPRKWWYDKREQDAYWIDGILRIVNQSKWTLRFCRAQGGEIIEKITDGTDINPGSTVDVAVVGGHLQGMFADWWQFFFFEIPGYPGNNYWCIRVGTEAKYANDALNHHLWPVGRDHDPVEDRKARWYIRCGWIGNLDNRGAEDWPDSKFTNGVLCQWKQYRDTSGGLFEEDARQIIYTLNFDGDDFGRE